MSTSTDIQTANQERRHPGCSKITSVTAKLLLNVRNYFEKEKITGPFISPKKVIEKTCKATGFSKSVICRVKTLEDVGNFPKDGIITRKRNTAVPPVFGPIIRLLIRDMIVDDKKIPTLKLIHSRLAAGHFDIIESLDHKPEFEWSISTLRRFMTQNGFEYGARPDHYSYTRGRSDITAMRDDYLEWVEKYRRGGYRIFYQDETWVFKNMAQRKIWKPKDVVNSSEVDYRVPSGNGDRSIISHIGSAETGLLQDCLLMFHGRKQVASDYHKEMNSEVFLGWLRDTVFPKLQSQGSKCVVVLDRASYHTTVTEDTRRPTLSWPKAKLVDAIYRWNGPRDDDWPILWPKVKSKAQIFEEAIGCYPGPKYKVKELADSFMDGEFEIKILFLPIAHPELNPIEMVWGCVKSAVSKANYRFRLSDVENMTRLELEKFTADQFGKYVAHVLKEESKYRQSSIIYDTSADGEVESESSSECDSYSSYDSSNF